MIRRFAPAIPVAALVAVVACSDRTSYIVGVDLTPPPAFVDPDAGESKPDGNDLVTYCPSDRCPPGHTTCPSSIFLCDVDLLTDPNNCGECGNACPDKAGSGEEYACVEGRCKLTCMEHSVLDCDGIPDNGCETVLPDNDNCGVCGLKCPADKPCIDRNNYDWGCGCRPGQLFCPGPPYGDLFACVDHPEYDDKNCGACRNACPPEGDGRERPPNMYFGCADSQCGALKCTTGYADCDSNRANGCETPLLDDDNCGACGNRCTDGMKCRLNAQLLLGGAAMPACMCPEGITFCKVGMISQPGGVVAEMGYCADLASSSTDCGGCGQGCPGASRTVAVACVYGRCERTCTAGWGDCNGSASDNCETDLKSDPKNCGACGNVCDGIAGQACVDGQCMAEPCDVLEDGGGPTR